MTPQRLLLELEPLPHDARVQRMVELGRAARTDAGVAATLAALQERGFYERWLALAACFGSGDGDAALRALSEASRTLRGLAIRLVPHVCDDAQAQRALETASYEQRRALLRRLAKRGRQAPIDAFLAGLTDSEARFVTFLPFGSAAVVAARLERAVDRADPADWRRLARRHPEIAAGALQQRAEAAERLDPRLVWQASAALPVLAERAPERALALVDALSRHVPLSRLALQRLTERRPVAMADRVLRSEDRPEVTFTWVARRLDVDRLLGLIERGAVTLGDRARWFGRLSSAQRASLYVACAVGWRDADGCLESEIVARLGREQRELEGRRHLALPALATRPLERLPYAAFLPWDDAREMLAPLLQNPDADLRAAALSTLMSATRYHRDRLPDLLAVVRSRQNEQDPVRGSMLAGLADLPPSAWGAAHLEELGPILRAALDAADLSAATAASVERLSLRLLPFHPEWCAPWLATLVRERGQVSFWDLEKRLSDADARRIAPHLLPVLRAWETREREGALLAAVQSLGRRARVIEGLLEILERLLKETRNAWNADRTLRLIADHWGFRLDSLIPALLRADPSWITRDIVAGHLHRRRQDLLTPFLGQKAYRGRFSTGKTRFVPRFDGGFHRWTPQQQTIYARTLTDVAEDDERDSITSLWVVRQLAELPAVAPDALIGWASRRNRKPVVRDVALQALGRLDAGQGVPTLLEALEDQRARIAIYALRRALLEMPADRALSLLRGVSLEKVTVAKEVVRLLGELPSTAAYRELLALAGRDLHRDVRIALLRALWTHLEEAEPWALFADTARSPDPAVALSVARIPADRLSPAAQQRLAALLATLLSHLEPTVRMEVLRRCAQLPVADREQVLLAPLLAALGSPLPDESAAAADAVFAIASAADAELVGAAVAGLLPHRRAVQTVVRHLESALGGSRGSLLPLARAVLDALARDPLTTSLRVELAVHALPWAEVAALLTDLSATEALHAEALMVAVRTIETARARRETLFLPPMEAALGTADDPRLRRLGLAALVALSQDPQGWHEERLARLGFYRADPSPLVAGAAQFILPPGADTT